MSHMSGLLSLTTPLLAQSAAQPFILMSIVKPLVTLVAFVPYASVTSGKLVKDAAYYHLNPIKWGAIFVAFAAAALLTVLLVPFWAAGFAGQVILLCVPCFWYMSSRNKAAKDAKPLRFLNLDFGKMAEERRSRSAQQSVQLRFQKKDRSEVAVPNQKDPGYAIYLAAQEMILPALDGRTQRLDVLLTKQGAAVVQVVDGQRGKLPSLAAEVATGAVDLLKGAAGLEPGERRKYQRGGFAVLRGDSKINVTLSSTGSMQGETLRVEIEREKQLTIPLEKSGMLEPQLKLLRETLAAEPKGGVVLVGARAGNGMTTLGYGLLSGHDAFTSNIKTLERRPERQVDGVEHATFDASKADYATQLQTIIRRGPDVVMITETMEPGVGKVLSSPSARGMTLYAMLPSDSAPDLLAAWMKAVGEPGPASEVIKLVVVQRLVRKLCGACRVAYQPTPEIMKQLALPTGKAVQLYRASGKVLVKDQPTDCPTCGGTGYIGQTGAFEVLALDDDARTLLKNGDVKGAYMQARRAFRSLSLQEAALMKVRLGDTSLEEVRRAFAPPSAGQASAGQAAAGQAAAAPAGAPAAGRAAPRPPAPANRPAAG